MWLVRVLLVAGLLRIGGAGVAVADEAGPAVPPPEAEKDVDRAAEPAKAPAVKTALSLRRDGAGAIEGQWTTKQGDAVAVKQIKAADLAALQKDFAEAAKLLERAGGLDVKPPAGQANSISTSITDNNGRRKAVIKAGAVETTLEENQGKELRMRVVTRKADGVEIVEHEAATLEDLKQLDAQAGRKFAETFQNGPVIVGGGARQIQIRVGGAPGAMQPLFLNGGSPVAVGERTIRGYFRGTEVTIVEKPGDGMTVKLTRTVDGEPKTEEFTARDLKGLELQSAEGAALYRRFTGEE